MEHPYKHIFMDGFVIMPVLKSSCASCTLRFSRLALLEPASQKQVSRGVQ